MALDLISEMTGSGAPLVVLHGLFGSAANWRSVARVLADRFEVHALDLRNHGASPWADTMDYPSMAEDVQAYIDGHGLKRPHLLGHSMGGKVAMALALLAPESIERLIVADIAPVAYGESMTPYVEAMRSVDVAAAASRTEVQRRLAALLPDAAVAPFLAQNLVTHNDHFDWRINLAAIGRAMPTLGGFPAELRERRFDGPVTAITGATSSYVPNREVTVFLPMFPKTRLEVIEGAGHWVHADQPAAFVAAVRHALA